MSDNKLKMTYIALALFIVVMFFSLFPLALATEIILIFSLGLMAWLAYQYIQPWLAMRRQAYIGLTVKKESDLQGFKNSVFISLLAAIFAFMGAFGALLVVAGFGRISNMPYFEWILLTLSVVSFVLIYAWLDKKSDKHVKSGFRFIVLWPAYGINLFFIVVVYVAVFIFFADMPNYMALDWSEILELAKAQSSAQIAWIEWLLALDTAIQHFLYAGLQRLSLTETDESVAYVVGAKLLIWLLVLAFAALKFGLVWGVLLGMVAYVLRYFEQQKTLEPAAKGFSTGFMVSLAVLFGLYFLISQVNLGGLVQKAITPIEQKQVELSPRCKPEEKARQLESFRENFDKKLTKERAQLHTKIDQQIDAIVNEMFDHPMIESGIEEFLDWNFSVAGSYMQLFFKGADLLDRAGLEEYLADKFNEFAGHAIEQVVEEKLQPLDDLFLAEAQTLIKNITRYESSEQSVEDGCFDINALDFNLDDIALNYVGGGGVAGVIAARVSARVVAQVSARVAAQVASKAAAKAGVKVAGRATSVAAGSGAAAAALIPCAATGPAVAFCAGAVGIGVGILSWLTVDVAIVSIDELFNRDELRGTIYESLEEQKQAIREELKEVYNAQINTLLNDVQQQTYRVIDLLSNNTYKYRNTVDKL